ncbi:MAG TPA: hypothetical protein PKK06_10165 [Phycisphaerae bacterium]|nr:hypothetical protein [Phycisphaerae bacterium]HNU45609.1 hypothetical protein [Phycisphaerae bacterium]
MPRKDSNTQVTTALRRMLASACPGMQVDVGFAERWQRPCVTFHWEGFRGLLPEERFHRLVQLIPEDFRTTQMQGFVWLELAAQETIEQFLAYPRSEDAADREPQVYAELLRLGFFRALADRLGTPPSGNCANDFSHLERILSELDSPAEGVVSAKLLFIRQGVYCDCQIPQGAEAELARRYPQVR